MMAQKLTTRYEDAQRGRAAIMSYFEAFGGPVGSPASAYSGKGKHQQERLPAGSKVIGLSGTRVYATETRHSRGSREPRCSGGASWCVESAIRSLPDVQQAWVLYCYGPGGAAEHEIVLSKAWDDLSGEFRKGVHENTIDTVRLMLSLQLAQARTFGGFARWEDKLPRRMGFRLNRQQWQQTYRAYWSDVRIYLVMLDTDATAGVFRRLMASQK